MREWKSGGFWLFSSALLLVAGTAFSGSSAAGKPSGGKSNWYMANTSDASKERCIQLDFSGDPRNEILKKYRKDQVDFYPNAYKDKSNFLTAIIASEKGVVAMSFASTKERCEANYKEAVSASTLARQMRNDWNASFPSTEQSHGAASGSTWYAVGQGRNRCIVSRMSPANRLEVIREAGLTPSIHEEKSGGNLVAVEISVIDGGIESSWVFWKSKSACEASIRAFDIPDSYK